MKKNRTTSIYLREDGITAINLQELYQYNSDKFLVFDFTPHKENKVTGADWEWWWLQGGESFGAAVQAKSLKPDYTYDIGATDRSGHPQIERLLNYSLHYHVTPFYCLYNYWNATPSSLLSWPCQSFLSRPELWGCALIDGFRAWNLHLLKRYALADILPLCMPWHCIACCPGIFSSDQVGIATRACGIAKYLRLSRRDATDTDNAPVDDEYGDFFEPNTQDQPPQRIRQLIDAVENGDGISRELVNDLWDEQPPDYVLVQSG
jgi:predicted  nucleic acid-binding Zn-ribbon protein